MANICIHSKSTYIFLYYESLNTRVWKPKNIQEIRYTCPVIGTFISWAAFRDILIGKIEFRARAYLRENLIESDETSDDYDRAIYIIPF